MDILKISAKLVQIIIELQPTLTTTGPAFAMGQEEMQNSTTKNNQVTTVY